MSYQPDADEAPVDLTAGDSARKLPSGLNPDTRTRILAVVAAVLALAVILLLAGRTPQEPVRTTPTPDALVSRPVSLSIKGTAFEVKPVTVDNDRWQVTNAGAGIAEWVYGTVVNYVIGLYPTDDTTNLVNGLADGDPISLKMSSGAQFNYKVSGRQHVPVDSVADLFRQLRPGITLVVLGEGGPERLVVIGTYDVDREPIADVQGNLISIGAPTQIGDWRVTILSGQLAPDPGDPAQAFYYVTFNVEYLGAEPTSADAFEMKLIDGVRAEYIIDRAVSNNGPYGPPGGLVAPRNPTSFTAGYRVPSNVPGPALVWVFKPSADADLEGRFEVPIIKPTPTPVPNTQITVQINGASLSEDQSLLVISGGVGNAANQPVTISQIDVSLSTADNIFSDLRNADPPLPWTILSGQTMAFRLQFARPPGLVAILRIVTLQFELSGLR